MKARTEHRTLMTTGLLLLVFFFSLLLLAGCVVTVNTAEPELDRADSDYPVAVESPTVIYLVRHAEKEATSSGDPGLTPQGKRRAKALARFLSHESVEVLLSSDYERTRATLEPLALQQNLTIRTYDAGDPAALVARVLDDFEGRTVVIAGHSNTVPDLVRRFLSSDSNGERARADLAHDEYERIFVIIRPERAPTTLLELAFSGINP